MSFEMGEVALLVISKFWTVKLSNYLLFDRIERERHIV